MQPFAAATWCQLLHVMHLQVESPVQAECSSARKGMGKVETGLPRPAASHTPTCLTPPGQSRPASRGQWLTALRVPPQHERGHLCAETTCKGQSPVQVEVCSATSWQLVCQRGSCCLGKKFALLSSRWCPTFPVKCVLFFLSHRSDRKTTSVK